VIMSPVTSTGPPPPCVAPAYSFQWRIEKTSPWHPWLRVNTIWLPIYEAIALARRGGSSGEIS
jgi:hypothetical protein